MGDADAETCTVESMENLSTSVEDVKLSKIEDKADSTTTCGKEEQRVYRKWFQLLDKDQDGRIPGPDAVPFFKRSGLPQADLKAVWAAADNKRQGCLSFDDFVVAMRLIARHQQARNSLADSNVSRSPFPLIDQLEEELQAAGLSDLPANGTPVSRKGSTKRGGWFSSNREAPVSLSSITSVQDGLKELYHAKLRPLESTYMFNSLSSPALTEADFEAKPMVMLLGQYSTGKTTFIKNLLKMPYPGSHIGPEPTTDRFVVVMNGHDERCIPGNTVAVQADMPFSGVSKFGSAFLEKFEVAQLPHPLLEDICLIDTPGVLSGEKQRTSRSYDFTGVIEWFASKSDLILLLFDPHKLDISDEFKRVMASLSGHASKIRVVLNKAHAVDGQQLMRVYGALMWSLGKVLNTPEVVRVYIGSFSHHNQQHQQQQQQQHQEGEQGDGDSELTAFTSELFRAEERDLLLELSNMPSRACDRKVNEFVKRARAARINAFIVSHLRSQMPMFGRAKVQQRMLDNLEAEFAKIAREHHLPLGDFPKVDQFKEVLAGYSFDAFEKLQPKLIADVDHVLAYEVPALLQRYRNPYG